MKLCKDCRWFLPNHHTTQQNNLDYCDSPSAFMRKVDVVRGEHRPAFAESERMEINDKSCGPSARLWEPLPSEFTPADTEESADVSF